MLVGAAPELYTGPCPVQLLHDLQLVGAYQRVSRMGYAAGRWAAIENVCPLLRLVATADGSQRLAQRTAPLSAPIANLSYSRFREKVNAAFSAGIDRDFGIIAFRRGGATAAVHSDADSAAGPAPSRNTTKSIEKHYVKDSAEAHKKLM